MNPLNYALACKQSYQCTVYDWIAGWFINKVQVNLTRIDGDYVLVLRGSMTAEDWVRDLDALPIHDSMLGWVHKGFHEGLIDVYKAIRNCTGGEPISFTGHSLGGARARLLAGMCIVNHIPVKNLVTFGSPKPAFTGLKDIICSSDIHHLSYRNNEDIVPTLPESLPPVFDYVHTEDYILLDGGQDDGIEGRIKDHFMDLYVKGLTQGVQNGNSI